MRDQLDYATRVVRALQVMRFYSPSGNDAAQWRLVTEHYPLWKIATVKEIPASIENEDEEKEP